MSEYDRQNLVYEKEDLLISGTGKYPDYNFYRVAGLAIPGKDKGEAEHDEQPIAHRHPKPDAVIARAIQPSTNRDRDFRA